MKCSTYGMYSTECSAHYIRTCVLREIVLSELNKLLTTIKDNEDDFIKTAMANSTESHAAELKKARKTACPARKEDC